MAFTVRLRSQQYRPAPEVTLRDSLSGWRNNIRGSYADDEWRFQLPYEPYRAGFEFKFMLDRSMYMRADNIRLTPAPGGDYVYSDQPGPNRVEFDPWNEFTRPPITETSYVQSLFFPPNLDEQRLYDVIVVGSGIGGGVVADQLSDAGRSVLVLEAGSYLFPTHIANLPRQQTPGRFSKHVWGLWDELRVRNTVNAGGVYNGAAGINFGGRSIFWGGLIPRMTPQELAAWPEPIRNYLLQGPSQAADQPDQQSGYALAEQLMNASGAPASAYQNRVLQLLDTTFADYAAAPASVAVQYSTGELATIPAGMFSTADLLMESYLSEGRAGRQFLTINLNHRVERLETTGTRVSGVVSRDLVANRLRTFRARQAVLAAGTVESAKIVRLSNLPDPSGKVGRGITDHPVLYTHFGIPPGSPWHQPGACAKVLLRHKDFAAHPYNVVVELGSDFNQGRYVDVDVRRENEARKNGLMLCEVVFLFDAPLVESNGVAFGQAPEDKPMVTMERSGVANRYRAEVTALKDAIVRAVGGVVLPNDNLNVNDANLGDVAHEVGTLRLGNRVGPGGAVVDADLKYGGLDNLSVCDLSVFPTSPAANPTLTLTALAMRLADRLK